MIVAPTLFVRYVSTKKSSHLPHKTLTQQFFSKSKLRENGWMRWKPVGRNLIAIRQVCLILFS